MEALKTRTLKTRWVKRHLSLGWWWWRLHKCWWHNKLCLHQSVDANQKWPIRGIRRTSRSPTRLQSSLGSHSENVQSSVMNNSKVQVHRKFFFRFRFKNHFFYHLRIMKYSLKSQILSFSAIGFVSYDFDFEASFRCTILTLHRRRTRSGSDRQSKVQQTRTTKTPGTRRHRLHRMEHQSAPYWTVETAQSCVTS